MHDKTYLRRTIELFAAVLDQVHAALERGVVGLDQVQAAVNVDSIGLAYTPGAPLARGLSPMGEQLLEEGHAGGS